MKKNQVAATAIVVVAGFLAMGASAQDLGAPRAGPPPSSRGPSSALPTIQKHAAPPCAEVVIGTLPPGAQAEVVVFHVFAKGGSIPGLEAAAEQECAARNIVGGGSLLSAAPRFEREAGGAFFTEQSADAKAATDITVRPLSRSEHPVGADGKLHIFYPALSTPIPREGRKLYFAVELTSQHDGAVAAKTRTPLRFAEQVFSASDQITSVGSRSFVDGAGAALVWTGARFTKNGAPVPIDVATK